MKNVTITLDDALVSKARVEAAKQGKSLSRFVSELVQQRVGRPLTHRGAVEAFLAGPALPLTRDGRAPTTDELYE